MAELAGHAALRPELPGDSAAGQRERGPWLAVLAWAASVIAASVLAVVFLHRPGDGCPPCTNQPGVEPATMTRTGHRDPADFFGTENVARVPGVTWSPGSLATRRLSPTGVHP